MNRPITVVLANQEVREFSEEHRWDITSNNNLCVWSAGDVKARHVYSNGWWREVADNGQ